jgi:hypothetical protein
MIIKSNSIILASDLSPAFQAVGDFVPYKRGLFPIAFVDNLAFDVQGNRIRSKQIGGQEFSVESLAFSPTVSLSFDYVSSLTFDNENLLGMFFKGRGDFQSVFKGSNGQSCNLYFILSDLFGLDLIYQIKDRGNLNGLEIISFGNCTLSNYDLAIAAASLPKTSIQMEAVNMEMQVVSSNLVNVPAINLAVGNKDGAAQLSINNSEFITNLNALNTSVTGQPILPTYQTTAFNIVTENPQVPSIKISPWADAAISSIGFSIGIEREASYGFGSDFIYDKKIKFPIVGNLNISATALALNSGVPILTGAMSNEPSYSLELQFIDPNELKYINQSIGTLSGYADQNYKGFLTNNKYLKIDNAKLESHSHSIDYSSNLTVEFGFSFTCNEQNGLLMKWGQRSEKEGAQLFTYEGLKIQSSDGSGIDLDNYLYFNDASTPIIPSICASPGLSSDGLMLLTRDNTADFINYCVSPPLPTYTCEMAGHSTTNQTYGDLPILIPPGYLDSDSYITCYYLPPPSPTYTCEMAGYSTNPTEFDTVTVTIPSDYDNFGGTISCYNLSSPSPPPSPTPPPQPPPPPPTPTIYSYNGTDCAASALTIYTFVSPFDVSDFAYSDINATVPYTGYFIHDGETYYYSDGYGSASECSSSVGTLTFTAVDGGGFGDINWTSATNAVSYSVYRSEDSVDYTEIFTGSANAYEDYDVLGGGNYYWYNVAAFSGISSFSGSPQMVYFE